MAELHIGRHVLEDAASDPDRGAWTYSELQAAAKKTEDNYHEHVDHQGIAHRCYHACPSWVKIFVVSGVINLFWEVATFLPVHRFFEHLGLIT